MSVSYQQKTRNIIGILKRLYPRIRIALCFSSPWELMVAVILSAQTTDVKVNHITKKLFKKYRTIHAYAHASPREFMSDIRGVNYYKTKARHIIAAAQKIVHQYGGKVPMTMDALTELPGIGRKSANVIINECTKKPVGIVVDTHMIRLSRLMGLTSYKNPKNIELDLMRIVPQSEWRTFALRLVQYGRDYCPARKHHHDLCPLEPYDAN